MPIPWISCFSRSGIPKLRGRKPAAVRRLHVELLEDRTAMSSGWMGDMVGAMVSKPANLYPSTTGWASGTGGWAGGTGGWAGGAGPGTGTAMISKPADFGVDHSFPGPHFGMFSHAGGESAQALFAPKLDTLISNLSMAPGAPGIDLGAVRAIVASKIDNFLGTISIASGAPLTDRGGPLHAAIAALGWELGGGNNSMSTLSPGPPPGPGDRPFMVSDGSIARAIFGRLATRPMEVVGSNGMNEGLNFDSLIPLMMQLADASSAAPAGSSTGSNVSAPGEPALSSATEGWISFVATGGWGTPALQAQSFRGFDDAIRDDLAASPIPPVTATGDVSWGDSLAGPYSLSQDSLEGHAQVIELAPLPGSSLAMIATLWTVPSDPEPEVSSDRTDWGGSTGGGFVPHAHLASPPSWAGFVIGLDEAFEQSRVSVRDEIVTGAWNPADEGRSQYEPDEPLVAFAPLAPVRPERERDLAEEMPGPSGVAAFAAGMGSPGAETVPTSESGRKGSEAREDELGPEEEAQPGSEKTKATTAWGLSLLSASASVLIAGRAWIKRLRRRRLRLVVTHPPGRSG
jgi:hypothetical protein